MSGVHRSSETIEGIGYLRDKMLASILYLKMEIEQMNF